MSASRNPARVLTCLSLIVACANHAPLVGPGTETPCGASSLRLRCLEIPVPEGGTPERTVTLAVAILPATGASTAPPVVVLAGGPGQSAASLIPTMTVRLAAVQATRDIIFVDQRGTGGSNRLACHADTPPERALGPAYTEAEIAACRVALAQRADLARYTTEDAVADLEQVRTALGHQRWALVAGSYGTRVGLAYLRRHPAAVESAVLEGVVPPDYRNPLPHARASQNALDRLFEACRGAAPCRSAFPELAADLDSVLSRAEAGALHATLPTPDGPRKYDLDRATIVFGIHLLMFSREGQAALPALVSMASRGVVAPLASIIAQANAGLVSQIDYGMQLSVTCAEDVPGLTEPLIEEASRGTYLGRTMMEGIEGSCAGWPVRPLPADSREQVVSDVPVLLVSGALDPATPPHLAEQVQATLSRARHVILPGGAHVTADPCVDHIVTSFLLNPDPDQVEDGCAEEVGRLPFQVPTPR